jgi:VWFA-related protein
MRGRFVMVVVCLLAVAALAETQEKQNPQPTFRSGTTLIPVDVRVVGRDGKPIKGLQPSDFTITEDGVPQKIVHFSFQELTPQQGVADDRALEYRKPLGEAVAPQTKRIFLLVLGRGRQVGPVKGVEAALKFVKERVLPQDRVAVLAYNRATDFTSDHARLAETLQRYWKAHESIEAKLRQHFSGLAAQYAKREIPAHIQKEVDGIFRVPTALTSRSVDLVGVADAPALAEDRRKQADLIQRAEIAKQRLEAGVGTVFDQSAIDEAAMLDIGFDEYVEKSYDTESDLGNIYAGIRYLRQLDGEKHLVFLTPNGLFLPRAENANSIAAFANDSRVTVDVVHTYGMQPAQILVQPPPGRGGGPLVVTPSGFTQRFQNANSQQVARLTGGQMMAYRAGDDFFKRLDDSTRAQYLLGYSPSNGNWDGKYRRIDVKVNRKDAQVLYRHGYAARRETTPFDRQQYLTYTRIAGAANIGRNIDDIKIALETPTLENATMLNASLRLMPGSIRMKLVDGFYVGKAEVVAFCADQKQTLIGEAWQTVDFKLTEENYQRFARDGVAYTLRIPIKSEVRFVKAIVYDYTADLIGSAMVDLRKKP